MVRGMFLGALLGLSLVLDSTALEHACERDNVSKVYSGAQVSSGLKIVMMGGRAVRIIYEDRDDVEFSIETTGGVTAELEEETSMTAADVRAELSEYCSSDNFCGSGLACGADNRCEIEPYLECADTSCAAACDDEPDVRVRVMPVEFGCGEPGNYWDGTNCRDCAAGTSSDDGPCTPCPAGQSSFTGGLCEGCPAGQDSKEGGPCTNCAAGQSSEVGGHCTVCPAGTSSEAGGLCKNCPAGQDSEEGGPCINCGAGQSSVLGGLCEDCPAGQSSEEGGLCSNCGAGQSSVLGGLCADCPAGKSSEAGSLCQDCPAGQSSEAGGICTPEETTAPAEETTESAEETTAEETTAPADEITEHVEETPAPVEETKEPADETTAPVEEPATTEPAEETTQPAEETTATLEETSEVAEETTEPAEGTKQMAATTQRVEETLEPAGETPAPAEETMEPVGLTTAPTEPIPTPKPCIGDECGNFEVPTAGFKIDAVSLDDSCLLGEGLCWVVELYWLNNEGSERRSGNGAFSSIVYLPNAKRDTSGAYLHSFLETFGANNFPCSTIGYDLAAPSSEETACCLQDLVADYLTTPALQAWVNGHQPDLTFPGGLCNSASGSTLLTGAGDFIVGELAPGIEVVETESVSAGVVRGRLLIAESALQEHAAIVDSVAGTMHMFFGMAHLSPTGSRILDSTASQVNLILSKANYWAVASTGAAEASFVSYFSVRVHQVLDQNNAAAPASQYATVSLVLEEGLQPNSGTGLIPSRSVRVRKAHNGTRTSWAEACTAVLPPAFNDGMAQSCAPNVAMCVDQESVSETDRFAIFHVPLGTGFLDVDVDWQLHLEFAVSVLDEEGKASSTVMSASVLLQDQPGAVTSWCSVVKESADLWTRVQADLLVGSSSTDLSQVHYLPLGAQSPTALDTFTPMELPTAQSFEAGMLTLALTGDDAFFSARPDFSVQLEQLVTLHVNGEAIWNQVSAELAASAPFQVAVDYSTGEAELLLSSQLEALCPSTTTSLLNACARRLDVEARQASANVLDLGEGPAQAAEFMNTMIGGSQNPFARELGSAYAGLLQAEYGFDGRSKRGWWINAAMDWEVSGAGKLTLSQRVVMVALLAVDEGQGSTRRLLVKSSAEVTETTRGMPMVMIDYGLDVMTLVAAADGVRVELVARWQARLELATELVCKAENAIREHMQGKVSGMLQGIATGIKRVLVNSVKVDRGDINCDDSDTSTRRRALLQSSVPAVECDIGLVFEEAAPGEPMPSVDVLQFQQLPGVLSVTVVTAPPATEVFSGPPHLAPTRPHQNGGDESEAPTLEKGDRATGSGNLILYTSIAGGAGVMLISTIVVLVYRRAKRNSDYHCKVADLHHGVEAAQRSGGDTPKWECDAPVFSSGGTPRIAWADADGEQAPTPRPATRNAAGETAIKIETPRAAAGVGRPRVGRLGDFLLGPSAAPASIPIRGVQRQTPAGGWGR